MGWALPFLFMQLFVKARSAAEFVEVTQGSFLVLSVVGLALFFLFVNVAISRFPFVHWKEQGMRALREHSLRGFSKVSR
jgi:hypothetical protein